jgi:2-oxoisovalerate dehydrogenase E1 component alpha subunit
MGVLLWRGFSVDAAMAQCFGNEEDAATKGRQMPVVGDISSEFFLVDR